MSFNNIIDAYPTKQSLCSCLNDADLVRLSQTCKHANAQLQINLDNRDIDVYLSKSFPDPKALRQMLRDNSAVMCGGLVDKYRRGTGEDGSCTIYMLHQFSVEFADTCSDGIMEGDGGTSRNIRNFLLSAGAVETLQKSQRSTHYLLGPLQIEFVYFAWADSEDPSLFRSVLTFAGTYVLEPAVKDAATRKTFRRALDLELRTHYPAPEVNLSRWCFLYFCNL
jgi:hypothetical protein